MEFSNSTFENDIGHFQVSDVTWILKNNNLDKIAYKIAERMRHANYDLILVNLDVNSENNIYKRPFSNEGLIRDIIYLTGCSVLSIPKWENSVPFKNILLPIHPSSNIIKDFEQVLPIARLFNSIIHLLILNRMSNVLSVELNELFKDSKIQVIPKFIHHNNTPDTILAFACIIKADLICNQILPHRYSKSEILDNTWKHMIDRSEVPLFNYLY